MEMQRVNMLIQMMTIAYCFLYTASAPVQRHVGLPKELTAIRRLSSNTDKAVGYVMYDSDKRVLSIVQPLSVGGGHGAGPPLLKCWPPLLLYHILGAPYKKI